MAALADWRQVAAARALAEAVAATAAEAGAADFDVAVQAAERAAEARAPQRFTIKTSIGGIDPRQTPPAFTDAVEHPDVVRVVVAGRARLVFGTLVGVPAWPVSASAMAARRGMAAIAVRSDTEPALPLLAAVVERALLGEDWSLGGDDRRALAGASIRSAASNSSGRAASRPVRPPRAPPSARPVHTATTYGPTTPAATASRNP